MKFFLWSAAIFLLALSAPSGAEDAMKAGLAQMRAGAFAQSAESFARALQAGTLSPGERVRALYNRAVALDAQGQTQNAIAEYSAALRIDSRYGPALNNRGNAYRRLGQGAEAERDYQAALTSPGARPEYAYYGLGQLAESRHDTARARAFYRKALQRDSQFTLAQGSLAALDAAHPPPAKPLVPALRLGLPDRVANADEARSLRRKIVAAKQEIARIKTGNAEGVMVQIASMRSPAEADAAWKALGAKNPAAMRGLTHVVVPADLPGRGRFYRLRVRVAGMAAARKLCITLAIKGADCLIVKA